ncbi:MAG: adenylate/guanylate cyclase domain-containing protein [Candidatus Eremiobacteraeota bacterium]|nr:adenylate/guanylate cyclase domain-containing protein [Candidatus Eremiobacteraeota bacterium]MBC5827507.1 adenylate/guanylate cyclase domain-containing protein [Candidatus Eremiobacteraeota bacterium]
MANAVDASTGVIMGSTSAAAARPIPSGTITFLFSDIEGSTQHWERHRQAMQAALRHHDDLLRTAIVAHGGYVFKTVGDAFCASFSTAPDAICAALEAQRTLAHEDFAAVEGLLVRMAIHTGHADEREGDYFGPTVNRVARLLSAGHGGQVLLSGSAADLARSDLPAQTSLRDLGSHRLKDLAYPEHVFQLAGDGLRDIFPSLRSLDALPNNLPIQLTSFLGRDDDIREVEKMLERSRLVMLQGSGGVGKTRLALQVGARLLDRFPDGVWFVEMAPLTDPQLVASTVATTFGLTEQKGRPIGETLVEALKGKTLLLVLDNCEHLVAEAARLAEHLLRSCPSLRILATSREPLGIGGEAALRVPSLAAPGAHTNIAASEAARFPAVALFVERAAAVNDQFVLTDANAPAVMEICRRLDGIALALELAASRVKVLSPEQLLLRLNERFRILTGGSRTALPRQQTMRALIDWSYELLSENEKTVFRRVAIFAGGWTLEAATDICADESIESWDVLDVLSALITKSLVAADIGPTTQRYRLLESTRDYALERLAQSGEGDRISRRHAEVFLAVAVKADAMRTTTADESWLAPLECDIDNLRSVLGWTLGSETTLELAAALTVALDFFWRDEGLQSEAERWHELVFAKASDRLPAALGAKLWLCRARIKSIHGSADEVQEAASKALALHERAGDMAGVGESLRWLEYSLSMLERPDEAFACLGRALDTYRALGDKGSLARCLSDHGLSLARRGDEASGRRELTEALGIARAAGDQRLIAYVETRFATHEREADNIVVAVEHLRNALEYRLTLKNKQGAVLDLIKLSEYEEALGHLEQAAHAAREAVRLAKASEYSNALVIGIERLALLNAKAGHAERAARLLGYTRSQGTAVSESPRTHGDAVLAGLRDVLEESQLRGLLTQGAALGQDQAIEEALL